MNVVVGVEDGTNGFSTLLFTDGAFIIACVEFLEIEFSGRLGGPEAKIVGGMISISRDFVYRLAWYGD